MINWYFRPMRLMHALPKRPVIHALEIPFLSPSCVHPWPSPSTHPGQATKLPWCGKQHFQTHACSAQCSLCRKLLKTPFPTGRPHPWVLLSLGKRVQQVCNPFLSKHSTALSYLVIFLLALDYAHTWASKFRIGPVGAEIFDRKFETWGNLTDLLKIGLGAPHRVLEGTAHICSHMQGAVVDIIGPTKSKTPIRVAYVGPRSVFWGNANTRVC